MQMGKSAYILPPVALMKSCDATLGIVLGLASVVWAAPPTTLTTLHSIHALTNAEAQKAVPVVFEATVTYYRSYEYTLFVQDGDIAIYVHPKVILHLVPGDRVLVQGTTLGSFRPIVMADNITVIRRGDLPMPVSVGFQQLIRAQVDCLMVTVHGIVHSADMVNSAGNTNMILHLVVDGGSIEAIVDSDNSNLQNELLDADVELTGAESGNFDGKMQQTGVLIHVSSLANLKILRRANANPWTLPVTSMDEILLAFNAQNLPQRIRIHGTITYYQPGTAAVLQSGAKSLWIMTRSIAPLRIGDEADATGFPDVHDGFLTLINGEIQDSHNFQPVAPQQVTVRDLIRSKHLFDLVSVEGQVLTAVREASQDEYVIISDGYLFSAIDRHPDRVDLVSLPPIEDSLLGSTVRISGICVLDSSNPFDHDVPFDLLIRNSDDIVVVAKPSLLTVRNLIIVVGLLLFTVLGVGARGWILERRVRRQTSALAHRIEAEAAQERRRSRILEDINGSRPLPEIIERITELVSVTLDGARCWCQIADGIPIGNFPVATETLCVSCEEISAHSSGTPGKLFVALDSHRPSSEAEHKALALGAGLAALAIETRRLYSDLVHRSQFDLLTEIHNRFSLDRHLETLIQDARLIPAKFGLIYVDLDEFKQVNDECGHLVGDLLLQQVAMRMEREIRSVDMLARIGGDEFAILVPEVRNRADVEEIALRIERSFDEPVLAAEYVLHPSASVGVAVYPTDALTKDGLLNAADSAMYKTKNAKKQVAAMLGEHRNHQSMLKSLE
jgi:diguanylate cyclase (GGDEF)-like protein